MLCMRVMSLSSTMTLANCVSARAASRLNECLWNAEVHRGGTTAGLSIVDAAPSCEKVLSSVALRSLPRAMTMWMGSVVFTPRAERSSHVMRLISRVYAIQGALACLSRTQLRLKWKKRSMATSLLVLARLPLLLLQKADAVHSNVEWHPFEHMQASARSSHGPSWSAGGDGGIVGSLLHWYTVVLPLSCAPAMGASANVSMAGPRSDAQTSRETPREESAKSYRESRTTTVRDPAHTLFITRVSFTLLNVPPNCEPGAAASAAHAGLRSEPIVIATPASNNAAHTGHEYAAQSRTVLAHTSARHL